MTHYYHTSCLFTLVMPSARNWVFTAGSELDGYDSLTAEQQAEVTALIAEGLQAKAEAVSGGGGGCVCVWGAGLSQPGCARVCVHGVTPGICADHPPPLSSRARAQANKKAKKGKKKAGDDGDDEPAAAAAAGEHTTAAPHGGVVVPGTDVVLTRITAPSAGRPVAPHAAAAAAARAATSSDGAGGLELITSPGLGETPVERAHRLAGAFLPANAWEWQPRPPRAGHGGGGGGGGGGGDADGVAGPRAAGSVSADEEGGGPAAAAAAAADATAGERPTGAHCAGPPRCSWLPPHAASAAFQLCASG